MDSSLDSPLTLASLIFPDLLNCSHQHYNGLLFLSFKNHSLRADEGQTGKKQANKPQPQPPRWLPLLEGRLV